MSVCGWAWFIWWVIRLEGVVLWGVVGKMSCCWYVVGGGGMMVGVKYAGGYGVSN